MSMKTETGSHATPFQTEFLMGGGAAQRELRAQNFRGNFVAEPLYVIGYTLKPIIVGAHGLGEVVTNLVAAALLFDIRPVALPFVFFFRGVAPLLI
jgi:hypothetical protein